MPDIFIRETPKQSEAIIEPESEKKPEAETENIGINEDKSEIEANKPEEETTPPASYSSLLNVEKKRPHFFASYCVRPDGINFTEKLDREEMLLFLRKHFITNLPWMLIAILASLVPILILFSLSLRIFDVPIFPATYSIIIIIFYYFFIFSGYVFVSFLTWFYNISVVTNERVIDIDFSNLVFENVAATKISQLEDISYSQIGIVRSLFDYGDVKLQTAGTTSEFEFLAVPHPEKIIKIVNNLIGKE